MNRITSLLISLLLCITILGTNACKKKDDSTGEYKYIYGLQHDVPNYLTKSGVYTFSAFGITSPEEGITYTWVAEGFTPDTCLSQSATFVAPEKTGSYLVYVVASHDDYTSSTVTQTVTVLDDSFFTCFSGIAPGDDSIIDSRDNQTYYTRVYDQLEWFVQNLNWEGAGNPYLNENALGVPYGRLYTWTEATSDACPDGWRVPTNDDWADLATYINDGTPVSFIDNWTGIANPLCAYAKLNDVYVWPYSPRNLKSNTAGWNALPGGNSTNNGNNYSNYGNYGFWWSADQADETNAYYRYIHYDSNQFPYHATDKESFGASVRCVRTV
ncbi:MAG: hypothetical protein LBC84_06155 [Prevotellaceae bacterium]|nr:hypothetical protein [Prevotellaceae bacterium]